MRTIITFLSIVMLASSLAAQNPERVWNFDTDKPGSLPEDFASEVGEWKVVTDPTAPSKPNALAQTAQNSRLTFNVVLIGGTNYKDVDVSVKIKAVTGKEDQGGGLIWRAKGPDDYYVARYNPLEDNYRVYKVEKGRRSQLQSADIKHREEWFILRVEMEGDHIQCYYNDRRYLDVRDLTFQEAGRVGLWTKADAQSFFDDLTVSGK